MRDDDILIGKDFLGIIKEGLSNDNLGRYKVFLEELTPIDSSKKPIWAMNEVNNNKYSRWAKDNTFQSAGSYFPLHVGMMVNVRFRSNLINSAYINSIVSYTPLVDKEQNRDGFYLINKTVEGHSIYQDDIRGITHIMHNNGSSNIILEDDSIILNISNSQGKGVGGSIPMNTLKISSSSTKLQYGSSSIVLDDTGIQFNVGASIFALTETGFKFLSKGNIDIQAGKKINIQGREMRISGKQELHLHGNIVRVSGSSHLSLTSSVINITSSLETSIKSKALVDIAGRLKTKISGAITNISATANLFIESKILHLTGTTTTINGSSLALSGSSIMMDGQIMHGLGIGTAISNAMNAMNTSLDLATSAASIATVTTLSVDNPVMAVANSILTSKLPGSALAVGGIVYPVVTDVKAYSGISEKISYYASCDEAYSKIMRDQYRDLNYTHNIG